MQSKPGALNLQCSSACRHLRKMSVPLKSITNKHCLSVDPGVNSCYLKIDLNAVVLIKHSQNPPSGR